MKSSKTQNKADGGLHGGIDDAYIMKYFLAEHKVAIHDIIMLSQGDNSTSGADIMGKLCDFFSSQRRGFVIYFSGHGNKDGDWVLTKDFVLKFDDIFQAFANRKIPGQFKDQRSTQKLLIISDTCHSGLWVEKLLEKRQAQEDATQVWVQAGCHANQKSNGTAFGSLFTSIWAEANQLHNKQLGDDLTPIEVKREEEFVADTDQQPAASIDGVTFILDIGNGVGMTNYWVPMISRKLLAGRHCSYEGTWAGPQAEES